MHPPVEYLQVPFNMASKYRKTSCVPNTIEGAPLSLVLGCEVTPNQSLKRTRYGSQRLAATGFASAHCPYVASRRLPTQAA